MEADCLIGLLQLWWSKHFSFRISVSHCQMKVKKLCHMKTVLRHLIVHCLVVLYQLWVQVVARSDSWVVGFLIA